MTPKWDTNSLLSDLGVSVVLTFGFCGWTAPGAVHEPRTGHSG